jgi:hypothetical protein
MKESSLPEKRGMSEGIAEGQAPAGPTVRSGPSLPPSPPLLLELEPQPASPIASTTAMEIPASRPNPLIRSSFV